MKRTGYIVVAAAVVLIAIFMAAVYRDDGGETQEADIGRIGSMDIKELEDKVLGKDWDALDIIDTAAQPEQALELLTDLSTHDDPEVREVALNCVAMIADPRVPGILVTGLGDADEDIRLFALQALQTDCDESVAAVLIENLGSEHAEIRGGVALLLGQINHAEAVESLQARLKAEEDVSVTRHIKLALARLGVAEMKDEFASGLDVSDSKVRLTAIDDLRYIGDKDLAVRLLPALDDFGQAHLVSPKSEPEPEFARVCDAAVNVVVDLYRDNPFEFEVSEMKVYSDEELAQVRSFLQASAKE